MMTDTQKNRDAVDCRHCQTQMEIRKVRKYPGKWPIALMITGVLCCLFIVGVVVGLPLLLLGIYMFIADETISYCPSCGHFFKVLLLDEGPEFR